MCEKKPLFLPSIVQSMAKRIATIVSRRNSAHVSGMYRIGKFIFRQSAMKQILPSDTGTSRNPLRKKNIATFPPAHTQHTHTHTHAYKGRIDFWRDAFSRLGRRIDSAQCGTFSNRGVPFISPFG